VSGVPQGRIIDSCASTNDLARELAEAGAPHGAWISARTQTAGRGRSGRSWVSEPGNLFLSIVLRPASRGGLTWIPLLTAVGVCRGVASVAPDLASRLSIKWPNDLVVIDDQRPDGQTRLSKLGGILGESREGYVVVGIGINCVTEPQVDQATASLSRLAGREVLADEIREDVVREVLAALAAPESVREEFMDRALPRPGQEIRWQDLGTGGSLQGVVRGIGEHGELVVECEGEARRLYSEDVRVVSNGSSAANKS